MAKRKGPYERHFSAFDLLPSVVLLCALNVLLRRLLSARASSRSRVSLRKKKVVKDGNSAGQRVRLQSDRDLVDEPLLLQLSLAAKLRLDRPHAKKLCVLFVAFFGGHHSSSSLTSFHIIFPHFCRHHIVDTRTHTSYLLYTHHAKPLKTGPKPTCLLSTPSSQLPPPKQANQKLPQP